MAGNFELFLDEEARYRFRLVAPDGSVMAISNPFNTKTAAVAGISKVREYAGMGLISDKCERSDERPDQPDAQPETGCVKPQRGEDGPVSGGSAVESGLSPPIVAPISHGERLDVHKAVAVQADSKRP